MFFPRDSQQKYPMIYPCRIFPEPVSSSGAIVDVPPVQGSTVTAQLFLGGVEASVPGSSAGGLWYVGIGGMEVWIFVWIFEDFGLFWMIVDAFRVDFRMDFRWFLDVDLFELPKNHSDKLC